MLKNYTININNYSYFLDIIDAEQSAILWLKHIKWILCGVRRSYMYNALIVDDEKSILENIQKAIPWEELGIETVFYSAEWFRCPFSAGSISHWPSDQRYSDARNGRSHFTEACACRLSQYPLYFIVGIRRIRIRAHCPYAGHRKLSVEAAQRGRAYRLDTKISG